jgi:hypothetical protein
LFHHESRDLLAPRRQERQVQNWFPFAAFAALREIFRFSVAAQPHGLFVVDISTQETRKSRHF